MLRALICDDSASDAARLAGLLSRVPGQCSVEYCNRAALLMEKLEKGLRFDLYFLDIMLGADSGLELAKRLRELDPDGLIVFCSSSDEFYSNAYGLYAFNYLLKPVQAHRIAELLERAEKALLPPKPDFIINTGSFRMPLRYYDVVWIEAVKHDQVLHCRRGEMYRMRTTLESLTGEMTGHPFCKVHRSYVVNFQHVKMQKENTLIMDDGTEIPVSRSYKKSAAEQYNSFLLDDFEGSASFDAQHPEQSGAF